MKVSLPYCHNSSLGSHSPFSPNAIDKMFMSPFGMAEGLNTYNRQC